MAAVAPHGQLVGPCLIYIAVYGTAEPAVNSTPGGSWVELGATTGDQNLTKEGDLTKFYDNDHQGAVKSVTPQEDLMLGFTLANLTHLHFSRILNATSLITTASSPNVSRVPYKSGYIPTEYAIVMKGLADSPFGNFPAQSYFPRGVFAKPIELARGKTLRAELACMFHVLEDDAQSDGNRLGWTMAQTS